MAVGLKVNDMSNWFKSQTGQFLMIRFIMTKWHGAVSGKFASFQVFTVAVLPELRK